MYHLPDERVFELKLVVNATYVWITKIGEYAQKIVMIINSIVIARYNEIIKNPIAYKKGALLWK